MIVTTPNDPKHHQSPFSETRSNFKHEHLEAHVYQPQALEKKTVHQSGQIIIFHQPRFP